MRRQGRLSSPNDASVPPVVTGIVVGETSRYAATALSDAVIGQPLAVRAFSPVSGTTTVQRALGDAIAIGAPAYDDGDRLGCYAIYRAVCEEVVARVIEVSTQDTLQRALDLSAYQVGTESGTRNAAWSMRKAMDRVMRASTGDETIDGMPEAAMLWQSRIALVEAATPGRPGLAAAAPALPATQTPESTGSTGSQGGVKSALRDAIAVGGSAYNMGNKAGGYYVYRRMAQELIARLAAQCPVRYTLVAALSRGEAVSIERGCDDDSASIMRLCFDEILRGRVEPPMHGSPMPTARAIRAESEFPRNEAACCILS